MINDKIIIALDLDSIDEAYKLVEELGEIATFYKIGISLFTKDGPNLVNELIKKKKKIFLDLKFFDIPNSMTLASIAAIELGVNILNYHCMAGESSLKIVTDKIQEYCNSKKLNKPLLIGVTVLTSVQEDKKTLEDVLRLANIANKACLDGIVCSAFEIKMIKQNFGNNFKVIVPGIRMVDNEINDQKRVATPDYAFSQGADYIVVGRPIIKAEQPRQVFNKILELSKKAIENNIANINDGGRTL